MNLIKRVVCWLLSWLLYGAGDLASRVLHVGQWWSERWAEPWCNFWYPVYNWLMFCSSDIQDAVGADGGWWPWRKVNEVAGS